MTANIKKMLTSYASGREKKSHCHDDSPSHQAMIMIDNTSRNPQLGIGKFGNGSVLEMNRGQGSLTIFGVEEL